MLQMLLRGHTLGMGCSFLLVMAVPWLSLQRQPSESLDTTMTLQQACHINSDANLANLSLVSVFWPHDTKDVEEDLNKFCQSFISIQPDPAKLVRLYVSYEQNDVFAHLVGAFAMQRALAQGTTAHEFLVKISTYSYRFEFARQLHAASWTAITLSMMNEDVSAFGRISQSVCTGIHPECWHATGHAAFLVAAFVTGAANKTAFHDSCLPTLRPFSIAVSAPLVDEGLRMCGLVNAFCYDGFFHHLAQHVTLSADDWAFPCSTSFAGIGAAYYCFRNVMTYVTVHLVDNQLDFFGPKFSCNFESKINLDTDVRELLHSICVYVKSYNFFLLYELSSEPSYFHMSNDSQLLTYCPSVAFVPPLTTKLVYDQLRQKAQKSRGRGVVAWCHLLNSVDLGQNECISGAMDVVLKANSNLVPHYCSQLWMSALHKVYCETKGVRHSTELLKLLSSWTLQLDR